MVFLSAFRPRLLCFTVSLAQWKLSERWTALTGLRAEYTDMLLNQATKGTRDANRYLNWIPSAYATYKLADDRNLRFSYSHRITALRGFYRVDTDMIRSRQYVESNQVLLTTLENGGANRSGGLEFTLNGRISPRLSVNTSGILALTQQQIDLNGVETKRTASSLSLRGRLNVDLTGLDHLQLQVNARGKTLAGSGDSQPVASADVTYRRDLTQALSLLVREDAIRRRGCRRVVPVDRAGRVAASEAVVLVAVPECKAWAAEPARRPPYPFPTR